MNENRIPEETLAELISQLLNDNISNDDFARLSVELEQCAQARTSFIELVNLHSELKHNFRLQSDSDVQTTAADIAELIRINGADNALADEGTLNKGNRRTGNKRTGIGIPPAADSSSLESALAPSVAFWVPTVLFLLLIGAVSAFIINGGLIKSPTANYVSNSNQPSMAERSPVEFAAEQKGVAVLTKDVNARWSAESSEIQLGKPIAPGLIGLESGLAQIDFFCGATMILEGPAQLEITDEKSGFVHSGKLRVFVPEGAEGFTLLSAQCEVVDLGTEFAMNVDPVKGAEVHVLDGEVRVRDTVSVDAKDELLTGGKAVRFLAGSPAEKMDYEEGKFVGPAEFLRLSRKAQNAGLDRWMKCIELLKQDDSLLAMYTFQESSKWDRLLINSRPESNDVGNGAIVGCEWTEGRWKDKRALRFSSPSHRVRINVPGVYDALSMSAWVKVDDFQHNIALTHPDTNQNNYVHWTLDSNPAGDKSSLHFSVSDEKGNKEARCHYPSTYACMGHFDLGKWVHVGVTYDPVERVVKHYKNGREVGSVPIERIQKIGLGIANMGNWPYQEWAKGTKFEFRNMEGSMDEFCIFSRAFSADEMAQIYECGKPAN